MGTVVGEVLECLRFRWIALANSNGFVMSSDMSAMITSLREELAILEDELRKDPRPLKIERIKALLELYEQVSPTFSQQNGAPYLTSQESATAVVQVIRPSTGKVEGSKAFRVKGFIRTLLTSEGLTHRTKILDALIIEGLMGHEKDPMSSLAANLSEWRDEFASDGKGNFYLRNNGADAPNGNGSEERP